MISATTFLQLYGPAKVNLFLELLSRRTDGYHELVTVMMAVDMKDSIRIRLRRDQQITVQTRWLPSRAARCRRLGVSPDSTCVALPDSEANLVTRALRAFQDHTGIRQGFDVQLQKRIPAAAGMGGASSNAATALLGAAALTETEIELPQLREIAATVGSDVPFFLGDTVPVSSAKLTGRGEQTAPFRSGATLWLVIVYPGEPCSTPEVYARCHVPPEPVDASPVVAALRGGRVRTLPKLLHNRLQQPAEHTAPAISDTLKALRSVDSHPRVTGSGSACYAIARNARTARRGSRRLAARLRAEVRCTKSTLLPGANRPRRTAEAFRQHIG